MKTIGEALAGAMALARPLDPMDVALGFAARRFAAKREHASHDVPAFDASLVDGYAVRSAEIAAGARRPVRGEARAGSLPEPLAEGVAARIFTGAPVPHGADAVVMQEIVGREGETATFQRTIAGGAGIRRAGSDLARGEVLLEAGTRLDAGAIALLASQGQARVSVTRAPRVALVTTGDEVVAATDALPPGGLFDANGPMLSAMILEAGGTAWTSLHARDDLAATTETIERALVGADLVLTVGGVSVGDHDYVHAALAALGVERSFWRVRMKPGKPLAVGAKAGVPVIGLPGNPVSAWVAFQVFVRPMLRRMAGDPLPYRRTREVVLGASIRPSADRTELARARLDDEGVAWPFAKQGSSALTSITGVDALLILPEREGELAAGDRVRAMLLDGRGTDTPPFT